MKEEKLEIARKEKKMLLEMPKSYLGKAANYLMKIQQNLLSLGYELIQIITSEERFRRKSTIIVEKCNDKKNEI